MKIGIDIGGSHIATGIVVGKGILLGKESKDIDIFKLGSEERVKEVILETIDMEIDILLKRYDFKVSDISRIGLAVPGSPTETAMENLVNLHIKKFEIGKMLQDSVPQKILTILVWFALPLFLLTLADRTWAWTQWLRRKPTAKEDANKIIEDTPSEN